VTYPRLDLLTAALVLGAVALLACTVPRTVPTIAPFDAVYSAYEIDRQAAVRALGPKVTYAQAKVATAYVLRVWSAAMHGLQAVAQAEQAGLDPVPAFCASRQAWAERGIHTK